MVTLGIYFGPFEESPFRPPQITRSRWPDCCLVLSSARLGLAISHEIALPNQAPPALRMVVMLQDGRVMCLGRSKADNAVAIVRDSFH